MTEESAVVVQGGIAATAIAFLQTAVLRMIPYAVPSLFLIALDLVYGIKAAKHRGQQVRFSTALRRTMTKTFVYVAWIIIASTLALAFNKTWLEWLILGLVYVNEFASIVGNYFETKGLQMSVVGLYRWIFRKGAEKVGIEVSKEEAEEIIKPKRDAKGRFVKRT